MRLLVIGHSNARADAVGEAEQHWPVRTRDGLAARLGTEVVLEGVNLSPVGPRAAPIVLAKAEAFRPDYVIVSLGAYLCAVGVVSLRVRQRFGERAARVYTSAENWFSRRTDHGGRLSRSVNHAGRRAARRIFGTATYTTPDEVIRVYREVVRGLASFEHTQAVVMGEHFFSRAQQRDNPQMVPTVLQVHRALKETALEHHFLWANAELALRETGRRDEVSLADGVHHTPLGHQAVAAMLVEMISKAQPSSR